MGAREDVREGAQEEFTHCSATKCRGGRPSRQYLAREGAAAGEATGGCMYWQPMPAPAPSAGSKEAPSATFERTTWGCAPSLPSRRDASLRRVPFSSVMSLAPCLVVRRVGRRYSGILPAYARSQNAHFGERSSTSCSRRGTRPSRRSVMMAGATTVWLSPSEGPSSATR